MLLYSTPSPLVCSLLQAKHTHLHQSFLKVALCWCNCCMLSRTAFQPAGQDSDRENNKERRDGGKEEGRREKENRLEVNRIYQTSLRMRIAFLCYALFHLCLFLMFISDTFISEIKHNMHINVYTSTHIHSDMWLKAQILCCTICKLCNLGGVLIF